MDCQQLTRKALRPLGALLLMSVAACALRFALRALDWPSFRAQLHNIDWRWLALAVVFDIASYAAQGWRWRLLLDGSTVLRTTRAIYAGLFINELIPLRPGEAVRAWLAARDFHSNVWTVVAPTMVAERLMDAFWLATALVALLIVAPLPHAVRRAGWILIGATIMLLAVIWILGNRNFAFLQKARLGFTNPAAILVSSGFLVAQGFAFWAVLRASHLPVNLPAAFMVMIIVRIGTIIPLAPANLGTHQLSTVLALSWFGIPGHQAAGAAIVLFTVLTLPLLLIGFGACLSTGITWNRVREFTAAQPTFAPE